MRAGIQSGIARSTRSIYIYCKSGKNTTSASTHFPHCTTAISVKSALFIMIVQNQHDFVRIMKGLTIHDGKIQDLAASALRCRGNLSMFRLLLLRILCFFSPILAFL